MKVFTSIFDFVTYVSSSLLNPLNPFTLLFFGFFTLGLLILIFYIMGVSDNK